MAIEGEAEIIGDDTDIFDVFDVFVVARIDRHVLGPHREPLLVLRLHEK
jgi:hypothetical protein